MGRISTKGAVLLGVAVFSALFISFLLGLILLGFALYFWDR